MFQKSKLIKKYFFKTEILLNENSQTEEKCGRNNVKNTCLLKNVSPAVALLKENHKTLQTNCANIKNQYLVAVQRRQVSK